MLINTHHNSPLLNVQRWYSTTLLDAAKWSYMMYRRCTPRGEMNSRPAPTPVFISDPSKYIVHNSACIRVVGSWVSIHSARKSAKI